MDMNQKLDMIARLIVEFSDTEEIVEFLTGIADRLKKPGGRTVCKETLEFLRDQIDWNADGDIIKTEYVYNLLDDMEKAMSSNKVRMNWPFLEESTQDGANREMDEEDVKAEKPPPDVAKEQWEYQDGPHQDEGFDGHILDISKTDADGRTLAMITAWTPSEKGRIMASALEMLVVLEKAASQVDHGGGSIDSDAAHQIRHIIRKARGGE